MKAYYDAIGRDYAAHRTVHPDVLRQLLTHSRLRNTSRVVEIGCGTGNYISAIQKEVGCESWGIDPSDNMLEQARKQNPVCRFGLGSAEENHLPHDWFDFSFSVDVVHHLGDRLQAFRACRTVLKPGGRFCIATDSPAMIRQRAPQSVYFPESIETELARYPTPETLIRELTKAGFEALETAEAEFRTKLNSIEGYRAKVFSALKLISEVDFKRGLDRLEHDFRTTEIQVVSRYLLIWGEKAAS